MGALCRLPTVLIMGIKYLQKQLYPIDRCDAEMEDFRRLLSPRHETRVYIVVLYIHKTEGIFKGLKISRYDLRTEIK